MNSSHDHRGKTFIIRSGYKNGCSFVAIDTFDKVFEMGWISALRTKKSLALIYCIEAVILSLPLDEEPLVGSVNGVKLLIHPLQFLTEEEREKEKEQKEDGTRHEVRKSGCKEGHSKKGAALHIKGSGSTK